ncbi:MAG: fibronectin type III domain-containing protein [Patescibacteria group bacterium]|jgi:hypothetical protein
MKKSLLALTVAVSVFFVGVGCSQAAVGKVNNLHVVERYKHKIDLAWKKITGADDYQVKVLTKTDGQYSTVRKVRSLNRTRTVKSLDADTTYYFKVRARKGDNYGQYSDKIQTTTKMEGTIYDPTVMNANIIFLHHSTGGVIWDGGVESWFSDYNGANSTDYQITQQNFPESDPYGWNNYPYDYWNIWVNHAGNNEYLNEPTLEILTNSYDVVVFKHCFPVSGIEADTGNADISSDTKTVENYKLQYNALKEKMLEFPDTKFIVWTGAALTQGSTDEDQAERAQTFFNWVKDEWDVSNDNIFVWDFYSLETDGTLYLTDAHAADPYDSHPSAEFAEEVAPYFSQRVVDVINGYGDTNSITGE